MFTDTLEMRDLPGSIVLVGGAACHFIPLSRSFASLRLKRSDRDASLPKSGTLRL
jgi:hypothetical protein